MRSLYPPLLVLGPLRRLAPSSCSELTTSCSAVALWPVTRRHMMMCSSRITWKDDRMGLQSSTGNRRQG